MEVLSRLLTRAKASREIRAIKLSKEGPPLSHLLFADDLLMTIRATRNDLPKCMEILDTFGKWSSQQGDLGKSGVFSSKNVSAKGRRELKGILGMKKLKLPNATS